MKNYLILLTINLICSNQIKSQTTIHAIRQKNYEILKNSVTYFVVPEFDTDKLEEYKSMLKSAWTFNTLKVITTKEAHNIDFNDVNKSRIALFGFHYTYIERAGGYWDIRMRYTGYFEKINNKLELIEPADIEFTKKTLESLDDKGYVSNNAYHNYTMGILKNCIQTLSYHLSIHTITDITHCVKTEKDEIHKISNDTVFIPDYHGEIKNTDIINAFEKVTFKYKIISGEELSKKILNSKKPFYYLNIFTWDYTKTINIINSLDGNRVFSYWIERGNIFDKKDVEKINKFFK